MRSAMRSHGAAPEGMLRLGAELAPMVGRGDENELRSRMKVNVNLLSVQCDVSQVVR